MTDTQKTDNQPGEATWRQMSQPGAGRLPGKPPIGGGGGSGGSAREYVEEGCCYCLKDLEGETK